MFIQIIVVQPQNHSISQWHFRSLNALEMLHSEKPDIILEFHMWQVVVKNPLINISPFILVVKTAHGTRTCSFLQLDQNTHCIDATLLRCYLKMATTCLTSSDVSYHRLHSPVIYAGGADCKDSTIQRNLCRLSEALQNSLLSQLKK